ncbi:putative Phytocyanin domain, cupredoxin [Arabidopsis thaliana]|uniref:Cupredoxin n=1 Tax=Arabidopsis thaliana x Arabidopsis arenosa TaxID=1240361 RepID=A0A8T2E2K4_9BRAS|nr:Cupredoxin [Arabidopsis thaliana x Arabidopsis arenosa]
MELWRFFWLGFWWFRLQLGWFKLGLGMELGRNRYKLGWGSSSGSNHSSGTGSTHNGHSSGSNHSSGTGSTHNGHSSGSNHSSSTGSTHNNHSSGSNHSSIVGSTHKNHGSGSNHSSIAGPTHNGHSSGSNHSSIIGSTHNHTAPSLGRKIAVTVWKNGYGYTEWTAKHAPFYVNDVLVFTYNNNDQTQSKTKHHHDKKKNDVYLLPDMKSFKRCNVARGKKLVARGGSSSRGFKLLLRKVHTYYFVSGDHNDCNHNMKFSVHPIPHPSSH